MSTENALARNGASVDMSVIERVVALGDLSKLSTEDRVRYYSTLCQSLGFNPLTRPFDYLTLNGKLVLYARKDATDQLRNLRHVSVQIVGKERVDDLYVVTARATLPDGRTDEEIGAVAIGAIKGDALANALMKAITKAKRRVTLSICGLGLLDESEVETIPNAKGVEAELPALPAAADPAEPAPVPTAAALVAERVEAAQTAAAEVLAEPAPEGEPKIVTDFYLLAFRERGLTRADVRRLLNGTPDVDDTELLRATLQEYHWPESGASLTRLWKEVVSLRADRERAEAAQPVAF